jgi:hypothetical protein
MSGDRRPPDDHDPDGDDELKRLLAHAKWPEPRSDQVQRLEMHWRQLQARRRRHSVVAYASALAASLLLAVGAAYWTLRGEPSGDASHANRPDPVWPVALTEPIAKPAAPPPSAGIAVREPSVYERVVLIDRAREARSGASTLSEQPPTLTLEGAIAAAIEALAADAQADLVKPLAVLARKRSSSERILWRIVCDPSAENRLGAVRLLARVASPRSLPLLVQLSADPTLHAAATLGLARLADDAELRQLALAETDATLRQDLLVALLARDTPGAIGEYLSFVIDPSARVGALKTLARSESPPIELLAAHLDDPRLPVRLAAAQALGSLNDPRAADRLRRSVAGIGRQEALMALLVSPSRRASQIVDQARQDVYLMASVQAAERQLQFLQTQSKVLQTQILPPQSGGNLP